MKSNTKKRKYSSLSSMSSSSSFAASAKLIPEEVIANEIVSRLPLKSVLRFRCVCKNLSNLIAGDNFVKMSVVHATRTADPAALAFGYTEDRLHIYPFNNDDNGELITLCPLKPVKVTCPFSRKLYFCIIDSRNGLVLCHEAGKEFDLRMGEGTLYIWNPSIGVFVELPHDTPLECPGGGQPFRLLNNGFVYDSTNVTPLEECPGGGQFLPLVNYGFVYDSTNDDYKVLKLAYFCKLREGDKYFIPISEVRIYSLRSNSWGKLQTDALFLPSFKVRRFLGPRQDMGGLFLNGALHWIMTVWKSTEAKIIAFDVDKQEYQEIQKPNSIDMSFPDTRPARIFSQLEVLKGSLCIFHNNTIQNYVQVWSMKEYGLRDSWTKLFTVAGPISEFHRMFPFPRLTLYFRPLKWYENGEILMMLGSRDLMIYDTKKDSARFVFRHEKEYPFEDLINHIETLENPLRLVKMDEESQENDCSHCNIQAKKQ